MAANVPINKPEDAAGLKLWVPIADLGMYAGLLVGFFIIGIPRWDCHHFSKNGFRPGQFSAIGHPAVCSGGESDEHRRNHNPDVQFCLKPRGTYAAGAGSGEYRREHDFFGMSGSATVDAAAIGQIEMKAMLDAGYDGDYSAGITAASSTVGPIVPPSIPLVIFGIVSGTSIGRLLFGGILPGIIIGLSLMLVVMIRGIRPGYEKQCFGGWNKIADISAGRMFRAVARFYLPLVVVLLLNTYQPGLVTFLPNLLMNK